jgi:hypothetical protein
VPIGLWKPSPRGEHDRRTGNYDGALGAGDEMGLYLGDEVPRNELVRLHDGQPVGRDERKADMGLKIHLRTPTAHTT